MWRGYRSYQPLFSAPLRVPWQAGGSHRTARFGARVVAQLVAAGVPRVVRYQSVPGGSCRHPRPVQIATVDVIHELLATKDAADKLGARAISIGEAQQLIDNRYVIVRTAGAAAGVGASSLDGW